MTKLTKKDFSNIITSAESVQLMAVLNHLDVQMLESDNNVDIFTIIDAHLDKRLNCVLETVPDFSTGRTYKARSRYLESNEGSVLTYMNEPYETYTQYRTADGLYINVKEWFDHFSNKNCMKVIMYAVKSSKAA